MSLKNHKIGRVTVSTATASAIGAATGQIIVHLLPSLEPIQEPITVLLVAVCGLIGGWLVRPQDIREAYIEQVVREEEELGFDPLPAGEALAEAEAGASGPQNRLGD